MLRGKHVLHTVCEPVSWLRGSTDYSTCCELSVEELEVGEVSVGG